MYIQNYILLIKPLKTVIQPPNKTAQPNHKSKIMLNGLQVVQISIDDRWVWDCADIFLLDFVSICIVIILQVRYMQSNTYHILILITISLSIQLVYAEDPTVKVRDLSMIKLPDGFKIDIFAEVKNARSIVRSEQNTIFVSTRTDGKVYAIKDTDGDFKADYVKVIASDLKMPNGIAIRDGNLYVAQISRILRFDDIQNNLDNPKYVVVKDGLPTETHHGWKFISFGPDGKLYLPIGAPCNICNRGDPYATINRMNADGTEFEVYARGVRNTVGFDWDPNTGYFWFTDNGRDNLGDNTPPDELNLATQAGQHFGYPFCHGDDIKDPQFGTEDCNKYVPPKVNFEAHVAALGVNFYEGDSFPQKYRGGMFIAQHGSWNRKEKIGYKVKFVKVDGKKVVLQETFAEGWLQGQQTKGRPVDTEQLSDGSLLVSDDSQGLIYRIYYAGAVQKIEPVTLQAVKTLDNKQTQYSQVTREQIQAALQDLERTKSLLLKLLQSTNIADAARLNQQSQASKKSVRRQIRN